MLYRWKFQCIVFWITISLRCTDRAIIPVCASISISFIYRRLSFIYITYIYRENFVDMIRIYNKYFSCNWKKNYKFLITNKNYAKQIFLYSQIYLNISNKFIFMKSFCIDDKTYQIWLMVSVHSRVSLLSLSGLISFMKKKKNSSHNYWYPWRLRKLTKNAKLIIQHIIKTQNKNNHISGDEAKFREKLNKIITRLIN